MPGTDGRVAAYIPMSYQLGGYTLYVPEEAVQPIPGMTVEELLKLAMTAGVGTVEPETDPQDEGGTSQEDQTDEERSQMDGDADSGAGMTERRGVPSTESGPTA